jgi:GlpG protein
MRLIGEFQSEKEAFRFQVFLQNHGIQSLYDLAKDAPEQKPVYRLWVIEEDGFDTALSYYREWEQDSASEQFQDVKEELPPQKGSHSPWKVRVAAPSFHSPFSLNNFIIVICGFLFLWYVVQAERLVKVQGEVALEYELTPIQKELFFDYPAYLGNIESFLQEYDIKTEEDLKKLSPKLQARFKKIQDTLTWKGGADMIVTREWTLIEKLPDKTLFAKIREGEVWRLITPVLLHGNLLHLLFNMVWLFVLGRQIEERIGRFRYLLLSVLLGVAGNVAQYLVSGPIFLGYSGIITGMVGFIWMRQKMAPWEGYPLPRVVIVFITVFVAAMLALEVVSMALQFFHITSVYANIANTAHIIGGLFGIALARLSLFSRSHR